MRGKTHSIENFLWTDLVISSHFREGETPSYTRINTVLLRCVMQCHMPVICATQAFLKPKNSDLIS